MRCFRSMMGILVIVLLANLAVAHWNQFRHDFSNTAKSEYAADTNGSIRLNVGNIDGMSDINPSILVDSDTLYYTSSNESIIARDKHTGALKWEHFTPDLPVAPFLEGDILYFGIDTSNVRAINKKNGTMLWEYVSGCGVASPPKVIGGEVYFLEDCRLVSNFTALHKNNGSIFFSVWLHHRNGLGSVAYDGSFLYVPDGDHIDRYWLNGTLNYTGQDVGFDFFYSTPSIDDERIFILNRTHLNALYTNNGTIAWTFPPSVDQLQYWWR